jgi:regulator of sirC expression with transglutaminase-like and TPR domain
MYRFRNNPAEFERSEGFFRMLIMAVVLAEDYHIHYDPEKITAPGSTSEKDGFFRDPTVVFLPGLLGPERKGTCSSMPVLYVAIGRKLGYPLKLVATKGHLFCRWDGNRERFNIEATAHGLSRFEDDYYRHWPFEISADEERVNGYLLSLTPRQELAVFLSIRGMCFRDRGRMAEAADCFLQAAHLDPSCKEYTSMAKSLRTQKLAN